MNKVLISILIVSLFFSLGAGSLTQPVHVVVLTADEVTSATDIEAALDKATDSGAHPGLVVLDSSKGDFVYTGDDRSINIHYSNITLRGKHRPKITNCGDGVFFDETDFSNVVIAGITFVCEGLGVAANNAGKHNRVIVKNNSFTTGSFAIEVLGANGWMIANNRISSGSDAIRIYKTQRANIIHNQLAGLTGVDLSDSSKVRVVNNRITARTQGVLLGENALNNSVISNRVLKVESAGITFGAVISGNRVLANLVSCAPGFACKAVDASPEMYLTNKILGNRVIKPK